MSDAHHVHMKTVTITELRRNIFRLIDETLETGEPIVLNRKGRRLVLKGDSGVSPGAAEVSDADHEAKWRKFWAEPSEINENLSLEQIEAAGEAYWRWSENPELDR
ncbi:MAG TPA: type II toxin-antitoxin system Phd/YefM family antitoxin [Caulobacteraceae bacterium]